MHFYTPIASAPRGYKGAARRRVQQRMKVALQHGRLSPDAAPDGPDLDLSDPAFSPLGEAFAAFSAPLRPPLPARKAAVGATRNAEASEESEAYEVLCEAADVDSGAANLSMLEGLGPAPDDEGELLQMRARHAEEARDTFTLQTTKSWQEVRYWLVRPASLLHKQIRESTFASPPISLAMMRFFL
jgi:hypothetical protein